MERVPTTKQELADIMEKYKGHVIATSACLGGELSSLAYDMSIAEKKNDIENAQISYDKIINFVKYCLDIFGTDFFIECAPSTAEDQKIVNRKLFKISKAFNIPMVIGTDAHYLTKEDRVIHKAYLNSKEGEREVDSFYEFTYVMEFDEALDLLSQSFDGDKNIASNIIKNTLLIQDLIQDYSLERK